MSALQADNDCGTHSAAQGFQICHCEEAAGRRGNLGKTVTFSPMAFLQSGRVLRDSHVASLLAMTNLGALRGRRSRSVTCQPARRSLSAATFSLSRRPCATSAATPHTSVHAVLTMPCTSRRFTAGPGCPLPYSTPRSAGFFSIVPYSPGKIHPVGKKRSLSVKSMEKRLKTGPFCDTINLYQNECTARRRGLHLHTDTTIIGGKHHECSRDHGTAQRIFL